MNKRIFVEKKDSFALEAKDLKDGLVTSLNINLNNLRVINIYDIFDITIEEFNYLTTNIVATVNKDNVFEEINLDDYNVLALEYLAGTFDIRAKSAIDCLKIKYDTDARIYCAKLYLFDKEIEIENIKKILFNTSEMQIKDMNILVENNNYVTKQDYILNGFIDFNTEAISNLKKEFSMSIEDLLLIQNYFIEENRDPSMLELSLLDTYWSDHCRHTTFETKLNVVKIDDEKVKKTYDMYKQITNKSELTFMDVASSYAKYVIREKLVNDIEISDEVNACSVFVDINSGDKMEKWLMMFKNETHNHPTEIEPYGGAATCLGGAIRDPLSGRSYVYQAMRISGSSDPLQKIEDTMNNKLPQSIISKVSAKGYSSYGNQIGLTTSYVKEIFHPSYVAKHMEVGAVIGAVKYNNIKREKPICGDVIMLLGGKTGKDGIGGATGSSVVHSTDTLTTKASEVQKGNPIEERKIQRLFKNSEVSKMIKKANDLGAGGISVAVGELADGIDVFLDNVELKYSGMNAFEIALSESQERMAVVISSSDIQKFNELCMSENIECTQVAVVTNNDALRLFFKGEIVANLKRSFLNTNGYTYTHDVVVNEQNKVTTSYFTNIFEVLNDYNVTSQIGLAQMFDSTIGNRTAIAQYGGKYYLSESDAGGCFFPTENKSSYASLISYGFDPYVMSENTYIGATYSVIDSIAKLIASGCSLNNIKLSFQEYFEKLKSDESYGQVLAALLGALRVQKEFVIPSIGGKDSMSGTYLDINVAPTLISFAAAPINEKDIITTDLKTISSKIYLVDVIYDSNGEINYDDLYKKYNYINSLVKQGVILAMKAVDRFGVLATVCKMAFGNKIGVDLKTIDNSLGFGKIIIETQEEIDATLIGYTNATSKICNYEIEDLINTYTKKFDKLYPFKLNNEFDKISTLNYNTKKTYNYLTPKKEVRILFPIFPGTNCEFDMIDAFKNNDVIIDYIVIKDVKQNMINQSLVELKQKIKQADILALSGGFSCSDEPDGSGKFIANILKVVEVEIEEFLANKKLIIGICNGFQALVESGLLPFGKIKTLSYDDPVLFKNDINSHVSKFVDVVITSNNSPWLKDYEVGKNYKLAISHGEGKFVASDDIIKQLINNGQIFSQYSNGTIATMDPSYNPNGSYMSIEGIVSPCGLILGKMGHNERNGNIKNIYGEFDKKLFLNAINYIKGEK